MSQKSRTQSVMGQNQITEGVIWKQLLLFFFPILFGTFFQQLYNTADAVIVGRFVGKEALAAVGGPTGTLINLLVGFFVGLSSGATVIISQFYGAKQPDRVSRAVHTSIAFSIVGGIVLMVIGVAGAPWALSAMGTPDDILNHAVLYMRIYFLGVIGNLIYNMGAGILRAIGDSKRPLYFLIASCFTNIVLDIVFVVFLHMGVMGAALATIISQLISAVLVIIVLMKTKESDPPVYSAGSGHAEADYPDRIPRGSSVCHVLRLQRDYPVQRQCARNRYHRRLDCIRKDRQRVLDDHQRLRHLRYHIRWTELRRRKKGQGSQGRPRVSGHELCRHLPVKRPAVLWRQLYLSAVYHGRGGYRKRNRDLAVSGSDLFHLRLHRDLFRFSARRR